jgi:hypothetical protein
MTSIGQTPLISAITFWRLTTHTCCAAGAGSHRDFSLAYWQSTEGMEDLEKREYALEDYGALELGDATCHHGWCLHYATPQPEDADDRAALSVSYFADGAKVLNTVQAR